MPNIRSRLDSRIAIRRNAITNSSAVVLTENDIPGTAFEGHRPGKLKRTRPLQPRFGGLDTSLFSAGRHC